MHGHDSLQDFEWQRQYIGGYATHPVEQGLLQGRGWGGEADRSKRQEK